MRPWMRSAAALCAAALLGVPGLALAQHAAKAHPKDQDAAGDAAQVAVDPTTDQIRQPTREEVQELLQGMKPYLDQSTDGLIQVTAPDGSVGVDLQDRFQSVSVARVGSAGVSTECVSTAEEARAFLERPLAAPAPKAPAAPALEEK